MKVTVSSTSMMKPILYTQANNHAQTRHPQRILGLLERTDINNVGEAITIYTLPNRSLGELNPVQWQNFLQIPDSNDQPRAAVFGFKYDGEQTWYQVWNQQTKQVCWLLHTDDFDYQPYAIMAMDALVTLVPDWNGEIYLHLCPASETNNSDYAPRLAPHQSNSHQHELLISDAATTSTGKLWFLVTVKGESADGAEQMQSGQLRTGWISQNSPVASAA